MVILSNFLAPSTDLLKKAPHNSIEVNPRTPNSPTNLHNFVLLENVFKTKFREVEMLLKCQKVKY